MYACMCHFVWLTSFLV